MKRKIKKIKRLIKEGIDRDEALSLWDIEGRLVEVLNVTGNCAFVAFIDGCSEVCSLDTKLLVGRADKGSRKGDYASYIREFMYKRKTYEINKFAKAKGVNYHYYYKGQKKPSLFDIVKDRDVMPF